MKFVCLALCMMCAMKRFPNTLGTPFTSAYTNDSSSILPKVPSLTHLQALDMTEISTDMQLRDETHRQPVSHELDSTENELDKSTSAASSRLKRQAMTGVNCSDVNCTIPSYIPDQVKRLTDFLNSTQYLGLMPRHPAFSPLPAQPLECPNRTTTWWPGNVTGERAICPWIFQYTDYGECVYPRFVMEAKCLCTQCVNANAMNCEKVRQEITVFQRGACNNGLAVMTAVKKKITVACACVGIPVQSPPGPDGPPVTD